MGMVRVARIRRNFSALSQFVQSVPALERLDACMRASLAAASAALAWRKERREKVMASAA